MKKGHFNDRGELFFEINLMTIDSSIVTVDAMLDTGFTDWLAMNTQDIEDSRSQRPIFRVPNGLKGNAFRDVPASLRYLLFKKLTNSLDFSSKTIKMFDNSRSHAPALIVIHKSS